ncbi:MAG: hypothetical protein ACOZCL_05720 [Bacillota bacterium]
MLKLLKYELIGRYKFDAVALITLITANTAVKLGLLDLFGLHPVLSVELSKFIMVISCLAVMVLYFIRGIAFLNSDLYSETGYLTFTLPISARSILGAKLLAAVIEFLPFSIVALYFLAGMSRVGYGKNGLIALFDLLRTNTYETILVIANCILSYVITMLLIYLSITITKSLLSNSKHSKIAAFGIFIAINATFTYIQFGLLKIIGFDGLNVSQVLWIGLIVNLISGGLSFAATQYLLDKRINL